MIIDASSVPSGEAVEADVCIIGAGPAGLALSSRLASSDLRVCLLESGGEVPDEATARLAAGTNVGLPYFELDEARGRSVGGSSHLWHEFLRVRPLDPIDFERREGLAWSGWPFGLDELKPFYADAHAFLDVDDSYDVTGDDRFPVPITYGALRSTLFRYTNTFDLTASGRGIDTAGNIIMMLRATVTELVDNGESIDEVQVVGPDGDGFTVRARAYVLACGGIDNARMLLAGRGHSHTGIGNENDLVGRFFMEHLHVRSSIFIPSEAVPEMDFYAQHHEMRGDSRGAFVLSEDIIRAEGLLNAAFLLVPSDSVRSSNAYHSMAILKKRVRHAQPEDGPTWSHVAQLLGHPLRTAHVATNAKRTRLAKPVYQLAVTAEQAPHPSSRVTLGAVRDQHGVPLPRLDWRLSEAEYRSVRRTEQIVDTELQAAGLGRLTRKLGDGRPRRRFRGHWHHMGTTRMHLDPAEGVVDADAKVHSRSNLYVAGSSVFPTGGYANPTLTIVALALRMAKHLRAELGQGLGPIW